MHTLSHLLHTAREYLEDAEIALHAILEVAHLVHAALHLFH